MSRWSELQPELLVIISAKQTNYADYVRLRAVCKSWRFAISRRPHHLLRQVPWLLLPYYRNSRTHRGIFNLSDNKTYLLELPEAYKSRCCGSSHGWLIMVGENLEVHLLNPLTRARIQLPALTAFPTFPIDLVFLNSRNLNEIFLRSLRSRMQDEFIRKSILSADPSLNSGFVVMAIHNYSQNLGFCRSGDESWYMIEGTTPPPYYEDAVHYRGKFYVIDRLGKVLVCDFSGCSPQIVLIADTSPPVPPLMNFIQWYLVELAGDLVALLRCRRCVRVYSYETVKFIAFKLELSELKWSEGRNIDDHALFLGMNCSLSLLARDSSGLRGNCIYFTDDYLKSCSDFPMEGHDFGVFSFDNGSVDRLCVPSYSISLPSSPLICYYRIESLNCEKSKFILPPPVWVTINPT